MQSGLKSESRDLDFQETPFRLCKHRAVFRDEEATFPLTPALSLGERENGSPMLDGTVRGKSTTHFEQPSTALRGSLSPRERGRGEGEGCFLTAKHVFLLE